MDETLSRCVLDLSGRAYPVLITKFSQDRIGEMDLELFHEFSSFSSNIGCNLHIENLYGINNHHIIESCFKALARALRVAISIDNRKRRC